MSENRDPWLAAGWLELHPAVRPMKVCSSEDDFIHWYKMQEFCFLTIHNCISHLRTKQKMITASAQAYHRACMLCRSGKESRQRWQAHPPDRAEGKTVAWFWPAACGKDPSIHHRPMEAAGVIRNTRRAAPHRRQHHTTRLARVFETSPYKTHDTELQSNNVSRAI